MHFAKKQFVSVKGPFKYYVSKEVGGWDWPKNKKNISKVKEKYSSLLAHKKGHFTSVHLVQDLESLHLIWLLFFFLHF